MDLPAGTFPRSALEASAPRLLCLAVVETVWVMLRPNQVCKPGETFKDYAKNKHISSLPASFETVSHVRVALLKWQEAEHGKVKLVMRGFSDTVQGAPFLYEMRRCVG